MDRRRGGRVRARARRVPQMRPRRRWRRAPPRFAARRLARAASSIFIRCSSLSAAGFGSIVNISSVDALSGDDKPQDAYGSSKAAMIRLSKSISIQFASYNIRSNTILPGVIDTPMQKRWEKNPKLKKELEKSIPINRVGKPNDIADGILFLLSDSSKYITGTELIIDGGVTAKP